jgi:hypothetical protein
MDGAQGNDVILRRGTCKDGHAAVRATVSASAELAELVRVLAECVMLNDHCVSAHALICGIRLLPSGAYTATNLGQ